MNVGLSSGGRRRAGVVAAALVGTALLAAACGNSNSGSSGAGDTAYQKAVAFAQCMRAHGEPDFPDPNSHGVFTFHGNPFAGPAFKACGHLLPNGGQTTPAQEQKELSEALQLGACMRSHGMPNFPDPSVQNSNIIFDISPGALKTPQFQAAQRACQKLMPGGLP
jgi:hypothetical protein